MPVFVLYPGPLLQLGHHDDDGTPLLPDHPPEFTKRFRQGSLSGDVSVLLPVAIDVVGVDVVTSSDPLNKNSDEDDFLFKENSEAN